MCKRDGLLCGEIRKYKNLYSNQKYVYFDIRGGKMKYIDKMEQYKEMEVDILNKLNFDEINDALQIIINTWKDEKDIYICGNGGSAATASHYVNDFNKGISERCGKKFRMHCLNDNVAIFTAIANDVCYEEVFRFQLQGILKEGDLVIGISGSGNSKNVIYALEYAKMQCVKTIAVTGYDGGRLREIADYKMHVPVENMQITEDIHMFFDHMIMHILSDCNNNIWEE